MARADLPLFSRRNEQQVRLSRERSRKTSFLSLSLARARQIRMKKKKGSRREAMARLASENNVGDSVDVYFLDSYPMKYERTRDRK